MTYNVVVPVVFRVASMTLISTMSEDGFNLFYWGLRIHIRILHHLLFVKLLEVLHIVDVIWYASTPARHP